MILLITYKENNGKINGKDRKGIHESILESVEEAVRVGQKSGLYYEVFDSRSGRVIDWNEVNIREEDDWYYDETELIWKKWSNFVISPSQTGEWQNKTTYSGT
jgi:hypothetical protein